MQSSFNWHMDQIIYRANSYISSNLILRAQPHHWIDCNLFFEMKYTL